MWLNGIAGGEARADELLLRVGLQERGHHYPSQLSGGEQQRVALARAFAPQPDLLLADEPTGNLDPQTGADILELLFELRDTQGSAVVLVTHDAVVAERADRRVRLEGGQVVTEETV